MRPNTRPDGQKRTPTFIEEARRRQIVETAIEAIADLGSEQTTLAAIASAAGISKGVISYHFDGKDELLEEVLLSLVREPAAYIKPRVDAAPTAAGKLQAYVDAFFEYLESHRQHYVALVDLWGSAGVSEGRRRFEVDAYHPSRHYLVHLLECGRASGEFRNVPVAPLAAVIQGVIDGVMLQWVFDPAAVDLHECRVEILAMVQRHIEGYRYGQSGAEKGRA